MQKLILNFNKFNQCEPITCEGETIGHLENFLHDIPIRILPYIINFALTESSNTKNDYLTGNLASIERKDGIISISSLYSNEPNGGMVFRLSVDQFVKLLQEWEKLVNAKAQKITITEDNGMITIKGE